jgi:hypothetical protein
VVFSALGGLRRGLALILAQTVLASHGATKDLQLKVRCYCIVNSMWHYLTEGFN